MVIVLAHSSAGFFPFRAAFSAFAPDRHPQGSFRGLLKLYTRYGPPDCSPTICGLCRGVPISPVTRTHRSPDVAAKHQLFEWVLPSLVISPCGAHAKAPNATYFGSRRPFCTNCGADPLVRAGPPGPAFRQRNQHHPHCGEPTGASAADRGVRPTINADCAALAK